MKVFGLIHNSIFEEATNALRIATGQMVDVECRDPVFEDILDDEGQPTGDQRFAGRGDPYPCQRERFVGGYSEIGRIGNWHIVLATSTPARLQAIETQGGTNIIPLAKVTETGDRWPELENIIDPADRTRINAWLQNHGYPDIPADWNLRQVVRAVLNRVHPDFDENSFGIADAG